MKQTYDTLRTWYLKDLGQPDIHHSRITPKARYIKQWEKITSYSKTGTFQDPTTLSPDSKTYCFSDIHWGHKNIIKYAEGARPYSSTEEMNDALIRNYLAVVTPIDTVIFGGDISFMGVSRVNQILDRLPGYKIQIVGNHDIERNGELMNFNMDERHLCLVRDIPDTNYQLLFTHYPLDTVPSNCVSVHGHIHQNLANEHNINICVEHTGCAPLNIKEVERRAIAYLQK